MILMVGVVGFEPTRSFEPEILSLVRLPLRHTPIKAKLLIYAALPAELRHPKADGRTRTYDTRLNRLKEISIGSVFILYDK